MQRKAKEIRKLISRLFAVAILVLIGYFGYIFVKSWSGSDDDIAIDNTPLKIEQVRSILELNTLRFQDEVVVDSTEYYKDGSDAAQGSIQKLTDYHQFKNSLSSLKRRLTLIVKGDLIYGVDLKTKDFYLEPKEDTLYIHVPTPTLLSIVTHPKGIETFEENGKWQDYEHQAVVRKAKQKMINTGIQMKLAERAKEPLVKLLTSLVRTDKVIRVVFE